MTRTNIGLVAITGVAVFLAGCGGSSTSPGVAHLSADPSSGSNTAGAGSSSSSSSSQSGGPTQQQMVAFSQCMRSHGVPEFPEPTEGHVLIKRSGNGRTSSGLDPRSARFQAARRACGKLLPNGGAPSPAQQAKLQESALKFSQCMRAHGVPNFPDPTFSNGGGTVQLKSRSGAGGIDPSSPQFKAAQKACQSALPKLPGGKGPGEGSVAVGGGPKGE